MSLIKCNCGREVNIDIAGPTTINDINIIVDEIGWLVCKDIKNEYMYVCPDCLKNIKNIKKIESLD